MRTTFCSAIRGVPMPNVSLDEHRCAFREYPLRFANIPPPVGINTSTSVAPATRTYSINCVRSMGHRDGKSASTAGKELRRVGSAFFGNNLDGFR
jgi:hypothetical protein